MTTRGSRRLSWLEFLDRGDPPVYVGFGSMGFAKDADRRREAITTALARAEVRGVLATGWGAIPSAAADPNVLTIDNVPHSWTFPRVAAVVHHGGAGTTAAGLRAGRPTLICPFLGDQPFWGHQIERLGVGPKPLPQRQLNTDRLTQRIRALVSTHSYADRSADIARRLRSEDGVGRAVEVLESIERASRTSTL